MRTKQEIDAEIAATKSTYATVDEVIVMLRRISESGKGHYIVGCNREYFLARKDEVPEIDDQRESVELGGYF